MNTTPSAVPRASSSELISSTRPTVCLRLAFPLRLGAGTSGAGLDTPATTQSTTFVRGALRRHPFAMRAARVATVVRFRTNSPALGVMGKDGALSPVRSATKGPSTVPQSLRLTLTATAGLLFLALLGATAVGRDAADAGAGGALVGDEHGGGSRRTQRPGLPDRRHAQGRPELPPQRAQPAGRRGDDVHAGTVTAPAVLPGASRADDGAVRPEQRRAPQLRPVRRLAGLRPVVDHRDVGPGRRLRDRPPRQAPQPLRRRRPGRRRVDELRHPARAGDRLRELHVLRRRHLHRRLRHHPPGRADRRRHRHLGRAPAVPDLRQPRRSAHLVPGVREGRRRRRPRRPDPTGRGGVRHCAQGPDAQGVRGAELQRGRHARQGVDRARPRQAAAARAEAAQPRPDPFAALRRRGRRHTPSPRSSAPASSTTPTSSSPPTTATPSASTATPARTASPTRSSTCRSWSVARASLPARARHARCPSSTSPPRWRS